MRRLVLILLLVPLGVVPLTGCGGSEGVSAGSVAQAANATVRAGGARVVLSGSVSAAGQQIPLKGAGTIEPRTGRGSLSLDMSSVQEGLTLDEIFDGTRVYLRSPLFDKALPHGKHWLTFDLQRLLRSSGLGNLSDLAGQNPGESLKQLRAVSGKVEKVGSERVAGVRTTHYRATIDLRRYPNLVPADQRAAAEATVRQLIKLSGSTTVPTEVWIDARHRVRRLTEAYSVKSAGQVVRSNLTIEFRAFGVPVVIRRPAAGDTLDVTDKTAALLRNATGG